MKILKIVDFSEWDIVSYQVLYLAEELKKKGMDVTVLCPAGTRLYAECIKKRIDVNPLNILFKFGMIESKHFNIVHFYSPKNLSSLVYSKLSSKNKKIVFSHMRLGDKNLVKIRSAKKHIERFIVPSKTFYDNLLDVSVPKKSIFTIPLSIKLTRWESAMRVKPIMFKKKPFQVLTISMDKSLREQFLFLKAARKALKIFSEDISFVILGNQDRKLRDMAREMGISSKVDIMENREDVPEIMAISHVFVKTTLTESLSLSLIEAQASGVPCVLPRLNGLSDFTHNNKNGILVEPGNSAEYADAIVRLLKDPELVLKISKSSFDYVEHNMSTDIACNLLLSVYEDLLYT